MFKTWSKRIFLFVATNVLVMATLSIAWSILSQFIQFPGMNQFSGLMIWCLFWGMGGAFISLLMSKWIAKRAMGVEIIDPNTMNLELRRVVTKVHELARQAGLPAPEVGVFDSPEINAFATGPTKRNSLVAVSTGLLRAMTPDEVDGVLGHEVAHIANGDMVTMTLIQGVVNAFAMFFSRILSRLIASQFDEKAQFSIQLVLTIVLDIVFTILGSVLVNYFSRRREFRADRGGAQLAGRHAMLAGLRKLKAQYDQIAPDDGAQATLKITAKSSGIKALFSTHPPLEERIARLERLAV